MPPRFVSILILIGWALSFSALLIRDVVPQWVTIDPPDMTDIGSDLQEGPRLGAWMILKPDPDGDLRSIGTAQTRSERLENGSYLMESRVEFDSALLLQGTPLAIGQDLQIRVDSRFEINDQGNLDQFTADVQAGEIEQDLLQLKGRVDGKELLIKTNGLVESLRRTFRFPYQSRGIVQNSLGPIDVMPSLQVGQRWATQVVNPLTGSAQEAQVEVVDQSLISWGESQVMAYRVVSRMQPFSMTVWVRVRDGLVLRQEIPTPLVKLTLERLADDPNLMRSVGP